MGKTGKLKAREKLAGGGGGGKRKKEAAFLNSAGPNNSEPGTG